MSVKFNWGTGIVIFIILFVSGMITLVFISFKQQINLVHKDYYPKEIEHQTMLDKIKNAGELEENVVISLDHDTITIDFPDNFDVAGIQGTIQLYRPSDFQKDRYIQVKPDDNGRQNIPAAGMDKGKYIVKVDWVYSGTPYYTEMDIHIK